MSLGRVLLERVRPAEEVELEFEHEVLEHVPLLGLGLVGQLERLGQLHRLVALVLHLGCLVEDWVGVG